MPSESRQQGVPSRKQAGRLQAEYAQRYRVLWRRHWRWRSRESFVIGWIERLHGCSPCRRILDVGCGDGLFFERLVAFGRYDVSIPPRPINQALTFLSRGEHELGRRIRWPVGGSLLAVACREP